MPMEITTSQCLGSSWERLELLITCVGERNEEYSGYRTIGNLVKVRFHCIQKSHMLQIEVYGQKIEMDKNVIVRASCKEPKYSLEKIWQDNLDWCNLIGEIKYSLIVYNDVLIFTFRFNITISAYNIQNTVQQEKLYNDTDFTDFCLSTAEGTGSVPVHKALLAAHSDVFRAMLSKEWKETKEGCIRMEGITLQTLRQLKDYMYLGTLPDDDLLPLWSIASCYLIEDLKAKCLLKLTDTIKPENFYSMLEYSIENKMAELTFAIIKATPKTVVWDAEKINNEKKVTEETEKE